MRETEESGMNSIVISDINDEGRSLGKTSNGDSTNNGRTRIEALSFMEKELKANEINLMEENLEVRKLLKQTNPDWYANLNNESTTSECFQEAMLMYTRDFKKMKAELRTKMSNAEEDKTGSKE